MILVVGRVPRPEVSDGDHVFEPIVVLHLGNRPVLRGIPNRTHVVILYRVHELLAHLRGGFGGGHDALKKANDATPEVVRLVSIQES